MGDLRDDMVHLVLADHHDGEGRTIWPWVSFSRRPAE